MRKFMRLLFLLFLILIFIMPNVYSQLNEYGVFKSGNLEIISYSLNWDSKKLETLYYELINNFHSKEFSSLSRIYLFPDSPKGVNGCYYDDVFIGNDGKYKYGDNAYIELYNADKYNTVEKIAPYLSHEYGHHYTICNITDYENKYYSQWKESEYYKIRGLDKFPICYDQSAENYNYRWDITEIAAYDYTQLLGSSLARNSYDYKDIKEQLNLEIENTYNPDNYYNLLPQINMQLDYASSVNGLYKYMLKIGGFTYMTAPENKLAEIKGVTSSYISEIKSNIYKIEWDEVPNGKYEYTLYMFPKGDYRSPFPIKTVNTGETMEAYVGSGYIKDRNGVRKKIQSFEGEYEIYINVKDSKNFVYKSHPYYYNFSIGEKKSEEEKANTSLQNNKVNDISPKKKGTVEQTIDYVLKYIG